MRRIQHGSLVSIRSGPFLNGSARLSADELCALQEQRFAALLRRGWEIPFYRRHWRSVGIEPGDVRSYRRSVDVADFLQIGPDGQRRGSSALR